MFDLILSKRTFKPDYYPMSIKKLALFIVFIHPLFQIYGYADATFIKRSELMYTEHSSTFSISKKKQSKTKGTDLLFFTDPEFIQLENINRDSVPNKRDSLFRNIKKGIVEKKQNIFSPFRSDKKAIQLRDSSSVLKGIGKPVAQILEKRATFQLKSGILSYNFNYRSLIDTPFATTNVSQQIATGNFNMQVAELPLRINFLLRRTNSPYFDNINNVQIEYDANSYKNSLGLKLRQKLLSHIGKLKDSIVELDYKVKLAEYTRIDHELNNPIRYQKLLESKEILNIPEQVSGNTDSSATSKIMELKNEARQYVQSYEQQEIRLREYQQKKDSAEKKYRRVLENVQAYKEFVQSTASGIKNIKGLKTAVNEFGIDGLEIPKKYNFLMNVRKMGIGRNQVNYSELTTKNMSITGLNFEYNSWYYVAITAGTVDFRFRDFVGSRFNRTPQFMYMARIGIGRIENNYFIVSAYQGKKQLFVSANSNGGVQSIALKGLAAEAKMKINGTTYIVGEVAQSVSPDFRKNPSTEMKLGLRDKFNLAYSGKLYSYLPGTKSRIEAAYKYTGGNFQSFNSFQTNSTVKAWHVKIDQALLNKKLKISASVRANEFSNDFIVQRYESNTVFKTMQASFKAKGFPFITAGYVPVSQLTFIDSILTENHFQSLNAGLSHAYKIQDMKANVSLMYSRFYNGKADSTIAYYNAENFFITNFIDVGNYSVKLSVSNSNSSGFKLLVLDCGLNFKIAKKGSIGFGAKGHDFNKNAASTGLYANMEFRFKNIGTISASYEKGYLPGNNHLFLRNDIMNINFVKRLSYWK